MSGHSKIKPLAKKIRNYYETHESKLSSIKRQHYFSRMALWTGEEKYWKKLRQLEAGYLGKTEADVQQRIIDLSQTALKMEEFHFYQLRKPFFKKYPTLMNLGRVLFLSLFAKTLYQRDIRHLVQAVMPLQDLLDIYKELYKDQQAIAVLSTYAINFFYLTRTLFPEVKKQTPFSPEYFLGIALKKYPKKTSEELCLQLYLLTHCIIGASQFYAEKIREHLPLYHRMLELSEQIVKDHYFEISLDIKCEFLVCAKILGKSSGLENLIHQEARASFSDSGDFIVDRFNTYRDQHKNTLNKSEHRNVLSIMSESEWIKRKKKI